MRRPWGYTHNWLMNELIALGLRQILAPNPSAMTMGGTLTCIVGRRAPVVIDPGPAIGSHLDAIIEALDGASPVAILLTHAHPDHAEGAGDLARRTEAPLRIGPGSLLPPIDGASPRHLQNGETFQTDVGPIESIYTPGHAPEHFSFLWSPSTESGKRVLFVGDLFMGSGDTTLVAPPEGDLGDFLRSLDVVEDLRPDILVPTHGDPLREPDEAIHRYRQHREERIDQVRAALESGAGSAAEIVDLVYGDELDPRLRGAAEGSATAILKYLRAEATD